MYLDYLKKEILKVLPHPDEKQIRYLVEFKNNMLDGINYYRKLFSENFFATEETRARILSELAEQHTRLLELIETHSPAFADPNDMSRSATEPAYIS